MMHKITWSRDLFSDRSVGVVVVIVVVIIVISVDDDVVVFIVADVQWSFVGISVKL